MTMIPWNPLTKHAMAYPGVVGPGQVFDQGDPVDPTVNKNPRRGLNPSSTATGLIAKTGQKSDRGAGDRRGAKKAFNPVPRPPDTTPFQMEQPKFSGFGDAVQTAANIASIASVAAPVAQAAREAIAPDTSHRDREKAMLQAAVLQQEMARRPQPDEEGGQTFVPWKGATFMAPSVYKGLMVAGNLAAVAQLAMMLKDPVTRLLSPVSPQQEAEKQLLMAQLPQGGMPKAAGVRDAIKDKLRSAKDFATGAADATLDELEGVVHRSEKVDPIHRLPTVQRLN